MMQIWASLPKFSIDYDLWIEVQIELRFLTPHFGHIIFMFAFRSNDDFSDEPKHLWSLASQKVLFMYLIIDKKILMNLIGAAALDPTFNGGKEADIL